MTEDSGSVMKNIYVKCCQVLIFAVLMASAILTIVLTPTNPIFKAAYEGRVRAIEDYLSEGGGICAQDKYNNTALHWAAKGGRLQVMKYLVNNGVNLSVQNYQGDTALHWAVVSNNNTILEYLVMQKMDVNAINNEGETPLHLAIMMNAFHAAQALLHLHADPNIQAKNGNLALHFLSPGCSEVDSCRNLMDEFKNAGCDFSIRNEKKYSVMEVVMGQKVNETEPLPEGELFFVC